MATQILAHPALRDLRERISVVEIPRPLWSCPGPWLADALDHLAAARAAVRNRSVP
jgi:iron complex transport system substrate-binding protein